MTPTEIIELNIACTLIGFLLGNRLAIVRDRRKEWNEITSPVRIALLSIKNGSFIDLPGDWEMTFRLIGEEICLLRRPCLRRAVEEYKKSRSEENQNRYNPETGQVENGAPYKDPEWIERAAKDLLKYLKPK